MEKKSDNDSFNITPAKQNISGNYSQQLHFFQFGAEGALSPLLHVTIEAFYHNLSQVRFGGIFACSAGSCLRETRRI
jgi:hypothetical protein